MNCLTIISERLNSTKLGQKLGQKKEKRDIDRDCLEKTKTEFKIVSEWDFMKMSSQDFTKCKKYFVECKERKS